MPYVDVYANDRQRYADITGNSPGDWGSHQYSYGRDPSYTQAYDAGYYNAAMVLDAVNTGKLDPYTAQLYLSSNPGFMHLNEEQEKTFNNLLARYQSQNALTWQKDQLQNMGLSAAGVLQTGAAHTAMDMSNVASRQANRRAQVLTGVANSFINMAGRMGSAGIHGQALRAVKNTASSAASTLAHSAQFGLDKPDMSAKESEELLNFFANR